MLDRLIQLVELFDFLEKLVMLLLQAIKSCSVDGNADLVIGSFECRSVDSLVFEVKLKEFDLDGLIALKKVVLLLVDRILFD